MSTSPVALDNTLGCVFIGVLIAMSLWGASTVQTYYYFNRYPKDELWLKSLVLVVWILDTIHQGMITHTAYTYLITEYGNVAYLDVIVKTLLYEVIVSGILVFLVQSFFVLRIYKLSHNNIYVVVFLELLVIGELVVSLIYTDKGLKLGTYSKLVQIANLSRAINALAAVSDVAIAVSLIFLLQRSRTGFRRSDTVINRLILFSLNTGLLTSIDALLSLITITVLPNTFVYILFFVTISRLYTNSLLATLNNRKSLSGGLGDESTGETSFSQRNNRSRAVELEAPGTIKGLGTRGLSIKVNTESETIREAEEGIKRNAPSESDTEINYHYNDTKPAAYPMHPM